MTAPMTPREAEIRKQLADAPGSFGNPAVVRDLLAEIDRLRALPVLRTCGGCAWHLDDRGGRDCVYPGRRWVVGTPDNSVPPPSWCPLRGGAR